ncbi:MFS transporter [Parafrigoribacterium humi]|uniref:MFS transporter n=1 Tax=Parafrigoribacterium humi TaxID=3144664 RepID=UPI0032ED3600
MPLTPVKARWLGPAIVLPFAIFWSTIDRALALPMIATLASDFQAEAAVTGWSITGYALAYSVLQLVWGPLQMRWGRVKVLWVSAAIGTLAAVASAAAPTLPLFITARIVSGGAWAATFSAVLVYFGDTLPAARRPAAMSNLATAAALGLGLGSLVAGAITEWASWRWVFAGFAVVSAVLTVILAQLPEPDHSGDERIIPQLGRIVRSPWMLGLYAFTILEGTLLIGIYNFLPQALQQTGEGVFVSGLVTAGFGVAVVVVSQGMKPLVPRLKPWVFMFSGGAFAVGAFTVIALWITPISVLVGASMMGIAWALAHTTLQTWITDAATPARSMGLTFFSISLMLGGSIGAALGQAAVDHNNFPALFAVAVLASVVFAISGAIGRARYSVVEQN